MWSHHIRYLGVGAMVVGGVWTLIRLRGSLASGIRSGLAVARAGSAAIIPDHERDIPMKWILCGIVLFTIPLGLLYQNIVGSLGVSLPMTLIMIVAGFLFCSVSAYMAGLVGSSNNPVSVSPSRPSCLPRRAAAVDGEQSAARTGGRHHDRRGRVLRRLRRGG